MAIQQFDRSHFLPRQPAGLLHPGGELRFIKLVVFVDVEVAHFLLLGLAGREGAQRAAAEEGDFDVLREAMDAEEPDALLDSVERRVPFDRLADAGDGARDDGVEALPDALFQPGMAAM